MAYYSKTIQEEELKNKVREEWFAGYDNTESPVKWTSMWAMRVLHTFGQKQSEV